MASESKVQRDIRKKTSELGVPMLRYQCGTFLTMDGRPITIGEPGVSDLIGITPHVITQEDVGRTVGIFTAMEVKRPGGSTAKKRRESQGNFLRMVNRLGGLGAIVKSPDEAADIVAKKWGCKNVIDYTSDES